ncbi:MAG TPA: hypothetical protein VLQ48_09795 [Chloroflexia bacterium]|nr:hypothetical protein [Chloroflexia bacterium]
MGNRTERVFILTAVLVVGLALMLAVTGGGANTNGAGSNTVSLWIMTVALFLIAATGALWITQGVRAAGTSEGSLPATYLWFLPVPLETVLPGLTTVGFVLFVQLFEGGVSQVAVLVLAALTLGSLYWAQSHALNTSDTYFGLAQTVLNVAAHICAFLLFSTIYALKLRSLYSSTSAGIVTFLLIFELLSRDAAWHKALKQPVAGRRSTIALLSGVSAVLVGELMWGLNYWAALTTLVGGAFLLVAFYVIFGLMSHYVDRSLNRRMMLEFGVVGAVAIVAVFASAFFGLE